MTNLNAASTNIEEVISRMERDGYAIVEGMLTRDEARAKREELNAILDRTPTGRNDFEGFSTRRVYALFAKTRCMDAEATHPLLLGVLDHFLGQYHLSAPVAIEIGPGETAQSLHRDDGVYPIARPHQELVLNTMWAMDDFTEENGATHVVPGSHKWVDQRPSEGQATVRAVMPAGSVMLFLGDVFHGGGANNSQRPRLGVILEYVVGWLRQQENQYLAVPREAVRELPLRLQQLIGYDTAPPFIGYVDGRHPLKSL